MIQRLCVESGARRRGLGSRLVCAALEDLWRERPAKVGIVLPLDNQRGVYLVRRLSFRREIAVARWLRREA